jgi:anti-sigma B factor antagonist
MVSIVDVQGDVTAFAEDALMDAYTRASAADARAIIIRINSKKQRLLTHGLSAYYRRIFEITRLDEAIGIFETEAEALNAARASGE